MGIPSYFSYIIKNHSNIIRNWKQLRQSISQGIFHSLYMDCNSIVYDVVNGMSETDKNKPVAEFEDTIITRVIGKINHIVNEIKPSETVYIAFDGVAPFAKMEQQRVRRYKNAYLSAIDFNTEELTFKKATARWTTSNITPGTNFMKKLSFHLEREYAANKLGVRDLHISTSEHPGEGEHKMFQYMRDKSPAKNQGERIAVYGLDSDLIMLSVFHCLLCENIWICRESPEFAKSVLPRNVKIPPHELLFLDIRLFARSILEEMRVREPLGSREAEFRIYDYIFMCFLLGNDFLPHFPALNIRTDGTGRIMDAYSECIAKYPDRMLISKETGKIQWKCVNILFTELAKHEHTFILQEYEKREKLEKTWGRVWTAQAKNAEEREELFQNTPVILRAEEKYICPTEKGWEDRYYKTTFGESKNPDFLNTICKNYLEGLEWVFKYYTEGCPHWRWRYQYHYPPLLTDLVKYVPMFEYDFIDSSDTLNTPFTANEQLVYVLPADQHYLLPEDVLKKLRENIAQYNNMYPSVENLKFEWTFCRYFWESHIKNNHFI